MRFISCHDGKLQTLETAGLKASPDRAFATGLAELDALAPQQSFARGAVHELLFDASDGPPKFVAALLAQAASDIDEARRHEGTKARSEGEDEEASRELTSRLNPFAHPSCLRAFVPSCLRRFPTELRR